MKFEKGKQYECIKDVVMSSGRIDYIKGRVYTCDNEGCLTDETGDEFHGWFKSEAKLYFKPYEPNEQPKTGDKVICWDEDEDEAEKFIFFTKLEGDFPYVVFYEDHDYDEFKKGYLFKCTSYKNMKALPNVETITKSEALRILKEVKGVEVIIEG